MKKIVIDNLGIPPLAGVASYSQAAKPGYSVDEMVALLKRLNYVVKRLHQAAAAHLARTPEWEVKCGLGYHLWLDAEHGKLIRARIAEMREPPLHLDAVPDLKLEQWMDEAIRSATTSELLTAIYTVVRPEILRSLRKILSGTNPVADHPTTRIVKIMIMEQAEMLKWGEQAAAAVQASDRQAANDWEAHLTAYMHAAGGVAGDLEHTEASLPAPRSDGQLYEMDAAPQRDERFTNPYNRSAVIDEYYTDEELPLEERVYALIYKRLREMDVPEWMGPILYHTRNKPWDYYVDLSRQLWDEVRHAMLGEIGCYDGGVPFYKYPLDLKSSMTLNTEFAPLDAHLILWYIEQGLMPSKSGKQYEWEVAKHSGHRVAMMIQDYDWADEVLHAQIGRKWLVPEFGNMNQAMAAGKDLHGRWREAQVKMLEWSPQTPWWEQFMQDVRNHLHEQTS